MKVEIFEGKDGQHYWRIRSRNGQIVAIGGEGYTRRHDALRGWKRLAQRLPMVIKQEPLQL